MSYEVIIPKPVQKQLKNLPPTINERVFARVRSLNSLRSRGSCYSVNTLKMFIKNELMLSDFLEDLKSADLVGISLNPQNLGLRLDFTFGFEADDVAIEFYQIIHLVFSQPLNANDEDICFWVGEVELKKIEDNIQEFLSTSYPVINQTGIINTNLQ